MNAKYEPMIGAVGRKALNDIGYDVKSDDQYKEALLGMIVVLAKQVKELQEQVSQVRPAFKE